MIVIAGFERRGGWMVMVHMKRWTFRRRVCDGGSYFAYRSHQGQWLGQTSIRLQDVHNLFQGIASSQGIGLSNDLLQRRQNFIKLLIFHLLPLLPSLHRSSTLCLTLPGIAQGMTSFLHIFTRL